MRFILSDTCRKNRPSSPWIDHFAAHTLERRNIARNDLTHPAFEAAPNQS
jgi:hypothetical protein